MRCLDIVWSNPQENQCTLSNLDTVSAGSCDEILLHDTLDYISNRVEGLKRVISKLKYGGTLVVEGNDIIDWARNIFIAHDDLDKINEYLYEGRQSADCINNMCQNLSVLGLEIIHRRLMATRYSVKARRPDAVN